jgi:hypothetical protein
MITVIGTPASQRTTSRNIESLPQVSGVRRRLVKVKRAGTDVSR